MARDAAAPAPARHAADMPPEVREAAADPDRALGRFIQVSELGRGSMGTVQKAWDSTWPVGRDQAPEDGRHRRRGARPVPPRGDRRRLPRPPEHRADLRRLRARRAAGHRDEVHPGPNAGGSLHQGRDPAHLGRSRRPHRPRRLPRRGIRPRPGLRPPGPQAEQPHAGRRRPRLRARLRPGESARQGIDHGLRPDDGDAQFHVARARDGPGARRGRPHRRLQPRRHALDPPRRPGPVPGQRPAGDRPEDHARPHALRARPPPRARRTSGDPLQGAQDPEARYDGRRDGHRAEPCLVRLEAKPPIFPGRRTGVAGRRDEEASRAHRRHWAGTRSTVGSRSVELRRDRPAAIIWTWPCRSGWVETWRRLASIRPPNTRVLP